MLPKADQPQDETHDACQGRQARNPGSDVTATAGTNSFQQVAPKFRSNLTWHLNMLAVKDLPRSHKKESKKTPARARGEQTVANTIFRTELHEIVPSIHEMSLR